MLNFVKHSTNDQKNKFHKLLIKLFKKNNITRVRVSPFQNTSFGLII